MPEVVMDAAGPRIAGVTLVVTVRDEAATVERLWRSICSQTLAPAETIFVDGGSIDGTCSVLGSLPTCGQDVRVLEIGPATTGRGRNVGIEAAQTDWIALTDAGIDLDPHWLDRLARPAEHDTEVGVVYGSYRPSRRTFFERCADLAYVAAPARSPLGPVGAGSIASALIRRDVWEAAGRFPDLRAPEDRIFMRRLSETGVRTRLAPEAMVTCELQPTLGRTFGRFRSYSRLNVLAGEARNWHYGIAKQYVVGSAAALLALLTGRRRWLLVLVGGGATRVGRTIWRRREGRPVWWALRPDRFAMVAAILAVIDAATFVGWVEGALAKRRRVAGER